MSAGSAEGVAALPAFFEFEAPRDWRTIDFISDIHLAPALPRTTAAWREHLLHTSADAVFVLGDLFETWVGDDVRSRPFEAECAEVLAEAASRRSLAFMAGNRDFLVGARLMRETGVMGLADPTVLDAWGRRVLLTHGDALCLDDRDYLVFRAMVRSDAWQRDFLARPLDERLSIAADIRRRSEARQDDAARYADVDTAAAVAWMHAVGTAELVHGHTHRPGSETLAPGYRRHVLTDWDLDDVHAPRAEVLRLTRDGFQRVPPATAAGA
ncbi:UDP-2,3-diacylglucosamine diphosphatase [Rubrivivax gelatinosus]|uniref:UDP-2,3-diacylglucosamine hydrolase n=1 Tax=Rubrivivax gelatinosus TaxID=28068 RepID=A0A4R2M9K8_RUBGE|nr:UDP-2,3-diacylglucosamine diphosphatase [Rubrivivax gelatinosus]MBK1688871.1 UDP-2,3-diacylglucosamine diphosphatase [Rubrivivax gelatinosus]TCP03090.1 UDP-2,3-diacylglucosamine hydrolase [Rubrivivax gelatinosus]